MDRDRMIMTILTTSTQFTAGSIKNNCWGHVGLHWAPIQLSISFMEASRDLTHVDTKSFMLVFDIFVVSQVFLRTLFLCEKPGKHISNWGKFYKNKKEEPVKNFGSNTCLLDTICAPPLPSEWRGHMLKARQILRGSLLSVKQYDHKWPSFRYVTYMAQFSEQRC